MSSDSEKKVVLVVSLSPQVYEELLEEARAYKMSVEKWARCVLGQWLISKTLNIRPQHRLNKS